MSNDDYRRQFIRLPPEPNIELAVLMVGLTVLVFSGLIALVIRILS